MMGDGVAISLAIWGIERYKAHASEGILRTQLHKESNLAIPAYLKSEVFLSIENASRNLPHKTWDQ